MERSFQELWWEKSEFGTFWIQKCQKCKNLRSKFQLLRTSFQELWWQKTWFGHFCKKISWVLLRKMCQNYFSRFFPWVHQKNRVVEKCGKITDFAIFPLGTSKKSGRSENLWQKSQPFCDFWDLLKFEVKIRPKDLVLLNIDCLEIFLSLGGGYTFSVVLILCFL